MKRWNKEVFSNIHQAKEHVEVQLQQMQENFDDNPSVENRIKLQKANAEMRLILHREEILWYQKSRLQWITFGDCNTNIFHHYTKIERQINYVHRLKFNGNWVEDQAILLNGAVDHFKNLLSSENHFIDDHLRSIIPNLVTDDQNMALCLIPSTEENRGCVFSLPGNNSPGPDGFTGGFFTHCWDIVGNDVITAFQKFFQGWGLPRGVTFTTLCLIPKVKSPISFADFRTISL